MTRYLRSYLALLLSFMLVLSGQGAAHASGMPDATGKMVICTGTGPVVLHVDAQGNPTAPPHLCPDCVMSVLVGVLAQGVALAAIGTWRKAASDAKEIASHCPEFERPPARDPPWQL